MDFNPQDPAPKFHYPASELPQASYIASRKRDRPLYCNTGRDSPPEPAPPEVPPRGPSLHATHTLRTQQTRNGCPPNATGNFTVPTDQIPSETYSDNNGA
ncbi:teneurin-a isoform X6 [Vespula squamosa]|uniref:Teneurin-a isoform X6 n=1 Tax=Vespula squamosa TaxID=30214 RepID=A0ABD2A6M0_VESSQ